MATLTAAAGLAVATPIAAADSIAYVKDGDVWLSTPDGARQYRVTTDGGYTSVSQSDAGTMAALRGDRIRTLERDGTVRHEITTPHSSTMPGTRFRGPFDPAISPDGERIAYSWYYTQTGESDTCNPSLGCMTIYGRQGTNYISPDGSSPYDKPGFAEQTGWVGASWTENGGTLLSDPIQVGNPDVIVHTPGDATSAGGVAGAMSPWFSDRTAIGGLADGEQTTDRTKLAFVTGTQHEALFLYRARGGFPTVPANCYRVDGGVGRLSSPSWSPDGTTVAFADGAGVNLLPLPSFERDCGTPTAEHTKRLLIPGASSPDWGPADVPAPRAVTPGPPPAAASAPAPAVRSNPTNTPTPTGPTVAPPNRSSLTLPRPVTLRAALRSGLPVTVTGSQRGKVRVVATRGGRTVASGVATAKTDGPVLVTLRFTRAARASLARRRSATFTLRAGAINATVTLRRARS